VRITGPFIGSLPPTPDRELKWWGPTIFRNVREVLPGRYVSAPPADSDYSQWKISKKLKDDVRFASHVFYGKKTDDWDYTKLRVCWYVYLTYTAKTP
jgi:hypothetical protein